MDSSDSTHSSWSIIEFNDKDVPNDELYSFSVLDEIGRIVSFGVLVITSTDSLKIQKVFTVETWNSYHMFKLAFSYR